MKMKISPLASLIIVIFLMIPAFQFTLGQEAAAPTVANEIHLPSVYTTATVIIPVQNAETVLIDRKDVVNYNPGAPEDDPRIILKALKKGIARVTVQTQGKTEVYVITVLDTDEADLNDQQTLTVQKIKEIIAPEAASALKISFVGNGNNAAMVLQGMMPDDIEARKVLAIAMQFTPTVLNYMTVEEPLQLRVKCDVVEADEGDTSNIGLKYRSASGVDDFEVPLGISLPRLFGQNGAGSGNWLFPFDPAGYAGTSATGTTAGVAGVGNFGFSPAADGQLGTYGFAIKPTLSLSRILSNTRILQSPTLTVLNGQSAGVSIGETVQLANSTTTTTGTLESYTPLFAGVMIRLAPLVPGVKDFDMGGTQAEATVPGPLSQRGQEGGGLDGVNSTMPMIDRSGLIRLSINIQVTSFISDSTLSSLPIVTGRTILTRVAMRDGESIVLGGLISDTMAKNMEKLPFLADLPIVGELFKNRTKNGSKSELIFVITPRIIRKDVIAKGDVYVPKLSDMAGQLNENTILPGAKPTRISARDILVRPEENVPPPTKMLLPRPSRLQLPDGDKAGTPSTTDSVQPAPAVEVASPVNAGTPAAAPTVDTTPAPPDKK